MEDKELAKEKPLHPTKPGMYADGTFMPGNKLATGNNNIKKLVKQLHAKVIDAFDEKKQLQFAKMIAEGLANGDKFIIKEFKQYVMGTPTTDYCAEIGNNSAPFQVVINVKDKEQKPADIIDIKTVEHNDSESV